jgi:uncharacterized membrane protein (DUF2068 family)
VIAGFKLVKGALLIAAAVGFLSLLHKDVTEVAEHWVDVLRIDPDNQHIQNLLEKLLSVDDRKLKEIGVGTFCYAAVFLTEGTGLLLRKRWAEYFTTIVTASFLPLEVYELFHRASVERALLIVVNGAIVVYFIKRLRRRVQI